MASAKKPTSNIVNGENAHAFPYAGNKAETSTLTTPIRHHAGVLAGAIWQENQTTARLEREK